MRLCEHLLHEDVEAIKKQAGRRNIQDAVSYTKLAPGWFQCLWDN